MSDPLPPQPVPGAGAPPPSPERRNLLTLGVMFAALAASFGTAVGLAARYIYPRRAMRRMREIFLAPLADIPAGKGKVYELPGGGTALVTNTGAEVVALSNVCPHLGCKVHWEEDKKEFFCPCHGGVFDPQGKALAGPPADEKKDLRRFTLKQVGENLFIQIEEVINL